MNYNIHSISRRKFMTDTAGATTGLVAMSTLASCSSFRKASVLPAGKVIGANDTINFGFIGIRGRGGGLIYDFGNQKNVRVGEVE